MLFLTLDKKGVFAAAVIAILLLIFGKNYGLFLLALLFVFLVLSAIVTDINKRKKKRIGLYEKSRGWKNVLANGIIPLFIAVVYFFYSNYAGNIILLGYIASIAAITADKFASEIGVLDGKPIMLLTLKRVEKGISGGVTPLGLAASAFASFIISLGSFYISASMLVFFIILISGFLGNIVDSLLGYYEEKGYGNKFTTNIACALSGFIFALLFFALAGI
ncbi:MAG: DUF92 domain-containing protein [Candidatus Micrarchaeia archaeon]